MRINSFSFIMSIRNSILSQGLILLASCTSIDSPEFIPQITKTVEPEVVPVEVALESLQEFLSDVEVDMTKSAPRRIKSVDTLSNHRHSTVDITEHNAYLVNFEEGQGFAILGATSTVAPIIAFVEKGNTSWEAILSAGEESNGVKNDLLTSEINPEQVMLMCVNGALYGHYDEKDTINIEIPRIAALTSSLKFGQGVSYCLNSGHHFVVCGCAATALSIAVAYNDYPAITADYELLDLSQCNTKDGNGFYYYIDQSNLYLKKEDFFSNPLSLPTSPSDAQMWEILQSVDSSIWLHGTPSIFYNSHNFYRTRIKLISSMFYVLDNSILSWGATGALPSAMQAGLEDLGYTNVYSQQNTSLTSGVILDIIDMLSEAKPVIMCGWSLVPLSKSHYWVVDGIRGSVANAQIHCNWGWDGDYNGWFSRDCIRMASGLQYDDGSTPGTPVSGDNQWANLVVFTYDMQNIVPSVSIHHLYDNKVSY